jgi:formate hydrogenlyase transcriptional activator
LGGLKEIDLGTILERASGTIMAQKKFGKSRQEEKTMAILNVIGSSTKFREMLDSVAMVAPVDSAVLIQGETGTGKEVIARAIHEASPRRKNRFVALNCAAIPGTLLESELFGHEKGAFTGAVTQRVGRFQAADCGTLFLDEIGDLPLELQPKLLRALQEKQFERLGGGHTLQVDVRVIAATNQDLGQLVRERKFRADLYYRLNVFPMILPPLRDRREDIPLLAEHFVQKFANQQGKVIDAIPEEVMEALEYHDWPGNIREMQNVIERGVIMTTGHILSLQTAEGLPRSQATPVRVPAVAEPASIRTLADAERAHITATLRETKWVIGGSHGAAAQLGLPRTTLIARMQRLGISSEISRGRSGRSPRRFVRVLGGLSSGLKDEAAADLLVMEAVAG